MFSMLTQRFVAATYSRVPLAGKLFLLLLGLMLLSSTALAAEIGPNDFRISTQDAAAGITVSAVAYNTSTNDYLVVWQGVDETGKPGIFGQLINANTGAEVAPDDFFIATTGTAGDPDSGAKTPAVVYNNTLNEFLVVFVGDTNDTSNTVDEVYAQRVSAAGSLVGPFLRLSDMGDDTSNYNAANPDVAYNSTADAYLVVWEGDDNTNGLLNNEIEIFGQLVGYSSGDLVELGNNDFQISDAGGVNGATVAIDGTEPAVAWNSTNNTYLVVWRADDLVDNDFDIFGQQLDANGAEIGSNDFQISTTTDGNTAIDTVRPDVAYNVSDNEYLVVWSGDGANGSGSGANDYEIWGQLLNANTGAAVGSRVQLSIMGSLHNSTFVADHPAVAYNSTDDEYHVVWHGDTDTGGLVDNEFEIFGTLLSPTLTTVEATQPLSDMGTNGEANPALQPPAVAYSEQSLNNFLVTWAGENPGVTDPGEVEVWGQLMGDAPVIAPSVTINQADGQADPTSSSPINFTVVFSEAVTGFADVDVELSGTAGATTAAVSEVAPNDGTTYNVAVSGMTSSGTVIADIPAGVASGNTASTSTDNTVTFSADTVNPEVTINQASGQADPTSNSPINFTVVFSEPVTGFANGDVTLSGTAGATTAVVSEIAPNDGTTYNVAVSGMTGNGTVIADILASAAEDGDSNPNNASTSTDKTVSFNADTVNPEVTINQASGQADPTSSSPINFTAVFNEPVTGFTATDVTLSGTAGATTAVVTQIAPNDGTTYNVAVSGMTGSGTVIADIPSGVAEDGDSNLNNASTSTDHSVTFTTGGGGDMSLYMSAATPGSVGGVNFGYEDILHFDGSVWSLFFDGSAAGLGSAHNISASHINSANDLYLSFLKNKVIVSGVGTVFGHDIVHWNGSSLSLFFDGSDTGLTTKAERIDALHILDGSMSPIGTNCDAYILISTIGSGRVKGADGKALRFNGEDILGFCLTGSGTVTSGSWHMALDGSAENMPRNATTNLSASADGQTLYITTKGNFNVDGVTGGHSMVYKFERATGLFSGPFFSAPSNGLTPKMDGLHVEGSLP